MMDLQFDAAAIAKLGAAAVWLHSSQSDEDTGSVWISSRTDSRPPRVYALGCEPGTPLSYINHSIDDYDTLHDPLDLTPVLQDLASHRYLNVLYSAGFSLSTGDVITDPDSPDQDM
jgi:hypothetical protein